jgi:hypothetical protein
MRCIQSQASTRVSEFRCGSCRWEDTFWGRHAHTCKTRRRDPRTHVRSSSGTNTQSVCRRTNAFYSRKRSVHLRTTPSARSIWISTSRTWSFSWTTTADASEYELYSSYCLGWSNLVFIVLYSYFSCLFQFVNYNMYLGTKRNILSLNCVRLLHSHQNFCSRSRL